MEHRCRPVIEGGFPCPSAARRRSRWRKSVANSYLQFEADGTVSGQIASSNLVLPVTGTCQTPFGSVALNNQIAATIAYPVHGHHKYTYSSDTQPFAPVAGYPNLSASATWYFTGLP